MSRDGTFLFTSILVSDTVMKCFIACVCCRLVRDNLLPVTAVGLMLHLLVTYGVTNKPFSLVSKGN